ncbi:MAG: NADP(H)-dependent aldo-keto reductase [Gammaproteobacteria bacterium]|nr:NADP(H)-dependent aldo-keto reductase [Gammaproteobacteria bacterium]
MEKRLLGTSDLNVSLLCLGTMTWGEQNTQAEAFEQMDYAVSEGINFFDTAEMYPVPPKPETQGATETIIGNWMAERGNREQVIIASKVVGRAPWMNHIRTDLNDGETRVNAANIIAAIDTSLARLQTDYIDLYQIHWPDRQTNYFGQLGYQHPEEDDSTELLEILSAMADLIKAGKIRHIGLSNETPWGLMRYVALAEKHGLPKPVSIQNPYNLLNRTFEVGLAECAIREQVPLLAYSPLAFGVLSGKYLNGARPENARLTLFDRFIRYTGNEADAAVSAYMDVAKENQLDAAQMALAFVNRQQFLGSNIIGATTMEQLKSNIASASLALDKDVLKRIEAVHQQWSNPCP